MRLIFLSLLAVAQLVLSLPVQAQSDKPIFKDVTLVNGKKARIQIPFEPKPRDPNAPPLRLQVPPDNSLWFRYYRAGEEAMINKDPAKEKQYLLASLGELEKLPASSVPKSDIMFLVKLSAVEEYLEDSYPKDWSKVEGDSKKIMKLRGEQVSTLYRISQVNDKFIDASDMMRVKSKENYVNARRSYEKAVAEASQSKTAPAAQ